MFCGFSEVTNWQSCDFLFLFLIIIVIFIFFQWMKNVGQMDTELNRISMTEGREDGNGLGGGSKTPLVNFCVCFAPGYWFNNDSEADRKWQIRLLMSFSPQIRFFLSIVMSVRRVGEVQTESAAAWSKAVISCSF